jgi:hypothetical protein
MMTRTGVALGVWLAMAGAVMLVPGGAPALGQADNPLFTESKDPKIISLQIRSALPPAERGLQEIIRAADQASIDVAVKTIHESYRYLRAAQQGTETALSFQKFPDPMMRLQIDHLWQIRVRLLKCVDNRGRLGDADGTVRSACVENLADAIRRLRVLVGVVS